AALRRAHPLSAALYKGRRGGVSQRAIWLARERSAFPQAEDAQKGTGAGTAPGRQTSVRPARAHNARAAPLLASACRDRTPGKVRSDVPVQPKNCDGFSRTNHVRAAEVSTISSSRALTLVRGQ